MKAAQGGYLMQLLSLSTFILGFSGIASADPFLDEGQKVCLAICGVDYDELMGAINTTVTPNSTIDVDGDVSETTRPPNESAEHIIRILSFDTGSMDLMGRQNAADLYFEKTGVRVLYDLIPDFLGTYDEIRSQLQSKLPIYDGFICGPAIVGTAVQLDGFKDLTDWTKEHRELEWLDVLRGFRENIAVFDNHVRMFPLDGDAHYLFYREDVLDAFDLQVPRTWEEYWQVAKAVHGKQFNGQEMVGSCVGFQNSTHLPYWTSLVLSSYTQTKGATQGFILDAQDLTPLMGEAMAETLKMMELQAIYGHPDVFEKCGGGDPCSINMQAMNAGICALTYNWGDSYKGSHASDSQVIGKLKVAPTPGTTRVYNRKSKKLEPCNEETCGGVGGMYYDDIGWVNRASYLAFGGWSAAVNNYVDEDQQNLILDFFTFMAGPEISTLSAIPNASTAMLIPTGVDPFRTSHLDVEKWVAQGYERTSAVSYMEAVKDTLNHPNAAFDMRFAGVERIYAALDEEVSTYLQQAVLLGVLPADEGARQEARMQAANKMETRFREIVLEEDAKPETLIPLLQQYQLDLGIYKPDSDSNQTNVLAIVIPIVIVVLLATALIVYFQVTRQKNDSVWKVKKEEIIWPDPQQVIGSGTFGLVLLAEYRGTQVAVKRVLPPNLKSKKSTGSASGDSGTKSWGAMSISGNSSGHGSMFGSGEGTGSAILPNASKYTKSTVSSKKMHRALRDDFIKEMRHLSKLRHPCITTVMGAVISAFDDPLLLMEYMDHGSLYDLLHNETVPLEGEILLPMLSDITQGCRFLHAANPPVIHGDLKSANILVDSRFRAKVADFGLSQKQQMGVVGTPFWMAPELLRRETSNNTETDVYAFGIILYEALSRKEPYEGENPKEVLKQVADKTINKRPPIPHGCPEQLAAIKSDCLLGDPLERPSFEELDKRLRRVDAKDFSGKVKSGGKNANVSLFDIFPKHVAEALRDGKQVEPEHKEVVTLFFSDIVGFTTISAELEPRKVANMLDRLYLKIDQLSHDYDVFKVETIGDAYMAVTNLVKDQSQDHATRIAEFAVNAIRAANETLIDLDAPEKGYVNIRVGFHSGPVVADVVGSRNPRYCLFGDTVNTASRMESTSQVNRVHCSAASAKILKEQNCKYGLISRGAIEVKGKGKMNTYWVDVPPPAHQEIQEQAAPSPGVLAASYGDLSC